MSDKRCPNMWPIANSPMTRGACTLPHDHTGACWDSVTQTGHTPPADPPATPLDDDNLSCVKCGTGKDECEGLMDDLGERCCKTCHHVVTGDPATPPALNIYDLSPCPECGAAHRAPFVRHGRAIAECDDCGHKEPCPPEHYTSRKLASDAATPLDACIDCGKAHDGYPCWTGEPATPPGEASDLPAGWLGKTLAEAAESEAQLPEWAKVRTPPGEGATANGGGGEWSSAPADGEPVPLIPWHVERPAAGAGGEVPNVEARLRALLAKVTSLPWEYEAGDETIEAVSGGAICHMQIHGNIKTIIAEKQEYCHDEQALIVEGINTLPGLLDALDVERAARVAAEGERDRARREVDEVHVRRACDECLRAAHRDREARQEAEARATATEGDGVLWEGAVGNLGDYRRLVMEDDYPECRDSHGARVPANQLAAHLAGRVRSLEAASAGPSDPLHAAAVLLEEVGELFKATVQQVYEPHKNQPGEVRKEAIQAAAMALRFVMSLDRYEFAPCSQHKQTNAPSAALAGEAVRG